MDKLEWSSPLDIVRYPDPRLRATNARIGVFDDSVKQLAAEMFEIMYRYEIMLSQTFTGIGSAFASYIHTKCVVLVEMMVLDWQLLK